MTKCLGAVILAAGLSERMGTQKLLLPLGGQPIFSHVVNTVAGYSWQDCVAVVGEPERELGDICVQQNMRWVYNPNRHTGQASSIQIGMRSLSQGVDGFVFILGDQPLVSRELLQALHNEFLLYDKYAIVVPRFAGQRRSPVLFGAGWREELLSLQGDTGGRAILEAHADSLIYLDWPSATAFLDADTCQDYQVLQEVYFGQELQMRLRVR